VTGLFSSMTHNVFEGGVVADAVHVMRIDLQRSEVPEGRTRIRPAFQRTFVGYQGRGG
jgi:hypothetical protein